MTVSLTGLKWKTPAGARNLCWDTHFSFFMAGSMVSKANYSQRGYHKESRFPSTPIPRRKSVLQSLMFTTAWRLMFPHIFVRSGLGRLQLFVSFPVPPPTVHLQRSLKSSATWGWTRVVWGPKFVKIWDLLKTV